MKRPRLRDDVVTALSDARGARQATLLLQTQVRTLREEVDVLKTASLGLSEIRATLADHLTTAHTSLGTDATRRRRRRATART